MHIKELEKTERKILVITGGKVGNLSVISNINKVLKILNEFNEQILLVTKCGKDENINIEQKNIHSLHNYSSKIFDFFFTQISIFRLIFLLRTSYSQVFFIFGQDLQILPILVSKILGKTVIIRSDGRASVILKKNKNKKSILLSSLYFLLEEIDYKASDILLSECKYMITENNIDKYSHIHIGNLFVDNKVFYKFIPFDERKFDLGYVGRLHSDKGINELISAILILRKIYPNIKIFIGGEGDLSGKILNDIEQFKLNANIVFHEWISHDHLVNYLNNIKIFILPSYREGLPNIILEAMASGTLIIASPVGGIPGVIHNKKTGFLLDNCSPECIVDCVQTVIELPDLEEIAENGRIFIEKNFSFSITVENWKKILK